MLLEVNEAPDNEPDRYRVTLVMPNVIKDAVTKCIVYNVPEYMKTQNDGFHLSKNFRQIAEARLNPLNDQDTCNVEVQVFRSRGIWFMTWPTSEVESGIRMDVIIPLPNVLIKYMDAKHDGLTKWAKDEIVFESTLESL